MYIDSFKVFCDLVETNSFSKAAAINHLTQSAVSQQVRAFEKRLGCKLFDRAGRSIFLSPEGQAFHRACGTILRAWHNLESELCGLRNEVAGRLRIVSIYSIGLHELPERLERFHTAFPSVEVEVQYRRSPQVYEMVASGDADLGLVAYPTRRAGLVHEIFDDDRLVIICHPKHALASRKRVGLPALNGERFIGFEPDTPTRKGIDRQLRAAGVTVTHATDFDNVETVKRAVEIGSGLSIVPASTVEAEVENGQLIAVEIDGPRMSRPLGIIVDKRRTRPVGLQHLIAVLKEGRKA
jgi:LysR family transcriptional regulator, transcriptional activator of the cysJI operon